MTTPHSKNQKQSISRRAILKDIALAPLFLKAAPMRGLALHGDHPDELRNRSPAFPFPDVRLTPHYPAPSPLADILGLVEPGSDDYITEKYAVEIEAIFAQWGKDLRISAGNHAALAKVVGSSIQACSMVAVRESTLRSAHGIDVVRRQFGPELDSGRD